jgi:putative MATE family efflux protein
MTFALLINILYSIVERMYIGHIPDTGHLALTGIGLISPIVTVVVAFQNLFGVGGSPLFSIARGRGDEKEAARVLSNACFMLISTGITLSVFLFLFKDSILYRIGASDQTFSYADDYLSIYLIGTVFVLISLGLNPYINAQGDARTGMFTVMIGAVINIILDPIFIFVFDLGVRGAAIATVIAQMCSAVWVLAYFGSPRSSIHIQFRSFSPDGGIIRRILALGVTEFVFQITNAVVLMLYNKMLLDLGGDICVTSMTVIYSVREISTVIMFGIIGAAKPIIGFNYGARRYDRVKQTIKLMPILNTVCMVAIWAVIMLFPELFIRIFNSDPQLLAIGRTFMRTFFLFSFFGALQVSAQSFFVSLGKAKYALFFSLLRKVVLIIPLTLLLPHLFSLGVLGVFLAEPLSELIGGSLCYIVMLNTAWKELSEFGRADR